MARILSLVVAFIPAVCCAQDELQARWEALRAGQPSGVELRIAAPKTRFYLGETIPLTLSFTAAVSGSFAADSRLHDRVGRLNFTEEYVAGPAAAVEDPLRGLPGGSVAGWAAFRAAP